MKQTLENIRLAALQSLEEANTPAALDELRVKWLGKKGELTAVLKMMGKLSPEERPIMGQIANAVRSEIEATLEARKAAVNAAALEKKLEELAEFHGFERYGVAAQFSNGETWYTKIEKPKKAKSVYAVSAKVNAPAMVGA